MQAREVEVLIIGAGASGIGAAIRLQEAGFSDVVLLEKATEVGGAWRDNTYPGCACDVPSALYSYGFAPNTDWSRAFARQPEILAYLRGVAERHGITSRVRFGAEVLSARWSDADRRWQVETTTGRYAARILISAAGPLHRPSIPDLPGLGSFGGKVFHSARWDHGYDLTGKRVAVIGTGASAVQFIPEIQPRVGRLFVYQRTASWVLPKPDHAVPPLEREIFRRVPGAQKALRRAEYAMLEVLAFGFRHPRAMRALQRVALRHLHAHITDPAMRAALTPHFVLGCKRILLSNEYYPALARPNVELHPSAVTRIGARSVTAADGSVAEDLDAIIFATGFDVTEVPIAERIHGADGRPLSEVWKGSPRGYLGTTVVGHPNLFFILGPNVGTGHTSAFSIIEAQIEQILGAARAMRERQWTRVEVRPEVERAFNDEVQSAVGSTVYNAGGCSSYYLDANGRNSTVWPWSTTRLVERVGKFEPQAYEVA